MKTFSEMPPHSRLWIYQADREFSKEDILEIKKLADDFIDQWTSHGKIMDACIKLMYDRFVIVCVDERSAPASGCGIDKSVRFIQQLEKDIKTSLLDRMNVAFHKENKIITCKLSEVKEKVAAIFGMDWKNATFFNNLIETKAELENNWLVPIKDSWLAQKMV